MERLPTLVFWPGEFHELYSPWDRRVGHDWATFTTHWLNIHHCLVLSVVLFKQWLNYVPCQTSFQGLLDAFLYKRLFFFFPFLEWKKRYGAGVQPRQDPGGTLRMNGVGERRHVRTALIGPSLWGRERERQRERQRERERPDGGCSKVWQIFIFFTLAFIF